MIRKEVKRKSMINMIYFDNSATSYPKPASVPQAMAAAVAQLGGNPGRGGHSMAVNAAKAVYGVREQAAEMFGAQPENTVFTVNCTHALNTAIKGVVNGGGHIIISSMEHNAVSRPIYAMLDNGVSCSVARAAESDDETVSNFDKLIRGDTKAIVCTAVSNVTGKILPVEQLAKLCREKGICLICDAAQAAGVIPLSLDTSADIICTAGHKGLFGPSGTGLLITNGRYPITPLMEGGTGTTSLETAQPDIMPERLESGTVNVPGIMGLGKGIGFVKAKGIDNIHRKEEALCELFIDRIKNIDGIKIYREKEGKYAPIVAFNVGDMHSDDAAQYLGEHGFALRGGYQCAAVTHHFLGTLDCGVVRFSPSVFNNEAQVARLADYVKKLSLF